MKENKESVLSLSNTSKNIGSFDPIIFDILE